MLSGESNDGATDPPLGAKIARDRAQLAHRIAAVPQNQLMMPRFYLIVTVIFCETTGGLNG